MFLKKNDHVPVVSSQMGFEQRLYVIDFLQRKKAQFNYELMTAGVRLAKEQTKRFDFMKNSLVIHKEKSAEQDALNLLEKIERMLDKVIDSSLEDSDLPELNELLDKKRYRMSLAWWRL